MDKVVYVIFFFSLFSCLSSQTTIEKIGPLTYSSTIPWNPKTYVCQRAIDKIVIDGIDDEASWKALEWPDDFVDIEGRIKSGPTLQTKMKMLWDDEHFYFFAKMEEPHIWAKLTKRDATIYQDDCFEIFIDPDGDGHHYYEFEINALNTIWDLFMLWPYRHKRSPNYLNNWNIDVHHAVHVQGSINDPSDEDEYWTVEMAIPWSALKEMAPRAKLPKDNDQWRVNFLRVDWLMDSSSGSYEKILAEDNKPLPENNWVWSPHGEINMHMPEWWGYVQFSNVKATEVPPSFKVNPDEKIKWALWQLYFQQTIYHKATKKFEKEISKFSIPNVGVCDFTPVLFAGDYGFQFSAPSCNGKRVWVINEMGKIISIKNQ